jgi:hypothetical protein
MNEHRRSLTPQERREFEQIRARLSEEMPDIEVPPTDWERWRRRASFIAVVVGLGLLVIGLLITIVIVAFVGFVLLAFALWRISERLDLGAWVARVRSRLRNSSSGDQEGAPGPS